MLQSCYPVLMTPNIVEARDLFTTHFGFEANFESDWYISLKHSGNRSYELALLLSDHDSIPADFRARVQGVLINYEVSDATAEWDRLSTSGLEILLPLRDEPWGQRHFIVAGSDNFMIDVIEPIPPAPGYVPESLAPTA